jgi:hypothetical protein
MAKRRTTIPDLRDDHDTITLDHCYVIARYIGELFDVIENTPGVFKSAATEIDPTLIQTVFQECFSPVEFSRLYNREEGKYILAGIFARDLLNRSKSIDQES